MKPIVYLSLLYSVLALPQAIPSESVPGVDVAGQPTPLPDANNDASNIDNQGRVIKNVGKATPGIPDSATVIVVATPGTAVPQQTGAPISTVDPQQTIAQPQQTIVPPIPSEPIPQQVPPVPPQQPSQIPPQLPPGQNTDAILQQILLRLDRIEQALTQNRANGKDNKGKAGKDQKGKDQKAKDGKGKEGKGKDGKEAKGKGKAKDPKAKDQKGKDPKAKDQKGKAKEPKGKNQPAGTPSTTVIQTPVPTVVGQNQQ
ncbi:hypothetical protein EDD86DRAFT_244220 [Gorgonomyces haynaldii]|nr:hypothetical protein EDD86DRAFT_244220 [Gorgonomyces haynaldii]